MQIWNATPNLHNFYVKIPSSAVEFAGSNNVNQLLIKLTCSFAPHKAMSFPS